MIGQSSAPGDEHHARRRQEECAGLRRHEVGAKDEDASRGLCKAGARPGQVGAYQSFERDLQVLHIGRRPLVEYDEIEGEPPEAQVFVCLDQLTRNRFVLCVGNPQKQNRQVSGDSHRPEQGLHAGAARDRAGGRAKHWRGIDEVAGKLLKQACFAPIDAEVMQLHLCLRPGKGRRALESAGIPVLVDEVQKGFARRGDHRPEGDTRDPTSRHPDAPSHREDGVENGTDGVRKRPAVRNG